MFAAVVRAVLPESEFFVRARAIEREKGLHRTEKEKTRIFLHETKEMLKKHWLLCIYAVLLMTGFNFLSHGSQVRSFPLLVWLPEADATCTGSLPDLSYELQKLY